jgi:hypothetical protein
VNPELLAIRLEVIWNKSQETQPTWRCAWMSVQRGKEIRELVKPRLLKFDNHSHSFTLPPWNLIPHLGKWVVQKYV